MIRGSYVKGTSFVGVNLFRSEHGARKDVNERLTCPYQGTLSTSQGFARPTTEGSRENFGNNVHVWGDGKSWEHTLIECLSWGPSNDSGLRMVNWQSKTPPSSPEDGHVCCIILIRVVFCHVPKNLPLHSLFYVTMNIHFCLYFNTARDIMKGLLIFVNIYHFTYICSHTHTEAHTHKHTCMISTQEEWRQPGTGAWLGGVEALFLATRLMRAHHISSILWEVDLIESHVCAQKGPCMRAKRGEKETLTIQNPGKWAGPHLLVGSR